MKIKLASAMAQHGQEALGRHANALFATLGSHRVVIAELVAVERTQVAPDEAKAAVVTVQIKNLEVAGEEQEDAVRQAMRALHTQRTAFGTLNEDQEVELAETTLQRCAGELNAIEAARLHVAIDKWGDYARSASTAKDLTVSELRHELGIIADALRATIWPGLVRATD